MRKTQTRITLLVMALLALLVAPVAQAQNFSEVKLFTTPAEFAREGGKNEAAGSILLNFSAAPAIEDATIMLLFSVPLAADIAASDQGVTTTGDTSAEVTGMAENEDNDGNGTIMIDPTASAGVNMLIQGVMLDVSGADGAVTVTLEVTAGMDDFIRIDGPSSATVISGIKVGVEASVEAVTVRTRGTDAGGKMVSLTLKESFKGAFMTGNMVTVEFSGIPEGASLTAMVTGSALALDDTEDPMLINNATATMVTEVKDGSATVTLGATPDEDTMLQAHDTVELSLTLTAEAGDEDISFPLTRGSVMAKASFTDPTGNFDVFEDAFTDYVTAFNIRPAQCEILFPVVTVRNPWNTAISVTNPAYEDEMASGGLTFTFYGMGDVVATYDTTVDPIAGVGLEDDGTLSPGGTYQVLANEILTATDWGETFQGHVHLLADYTNCTGLGWVTDFMGVNQAYSAVVIDADTGADN